MLILLIVPIAFLVKDNFAKAVAGTPQAGAVVYYEDFSSGTQTSTGTSLSSMTNLAIQLNNYTGGTAADYTTYTAGAEWLPGAGNCNGWILNNYAAAFPAATTSDGGCSANAGLGGTGNTPAAWVFLRGMADAIGAQHGVAAGQNNVVASMTNGGVQSTTDHLQLATNSNTIPAIGGHYYTFSADFVQVHCQGDPNYLPNSNNWTNAIEQMTLTADGVAVNNPANDQVVPCTATPQTVVTGSGYNNAGAAANIGRVYYAKLSSNVYQVPVGAQYLGLKLENLNNSNAGNDVAFDNLQITDVTPQLYKAFTPDTIQRGEFATLTYNITNTSELAAKPGWNFTDNLPTGVVAVGVPTTGTGGAACGNFSGTVSNGAVVISGDLAAGQSFCTVSVQVKVTGAATSTTTYTNGAANFPSSTTAEPTCRTGSTGIGMCGVLAPADATLTVTPSALTPDTDSTPFETAVTVDVLGNDNVPTGSTVTSVTPANPIQGSWVNNSDGTVTFHPANGFSGAAQATYEVTLPDGSTLTTTVTVNVEPSPVIPILVPDVGTTPFETSKTLNVLDNDTVFAGSVVTDVIPNDPAQGTWLFDAAGNVTFKPATGFSGTAIATYVVTHPDNTTSMSTVTITVLPPSTVTPPITEPVIPSPPNTGFRFRESL